MAKPISLQRFGEREDIYMALVIFAASVFGLLSLLPSESAQ